MRGSNMRCNVLCIFTLASWVLITGSVQAAKQLQMAPGEVICRDQQRALEYARRHPDFTPDPAFQCWPLAPSAQIFELQDVAANVRGRRMVAVQVVQPNFPPFNGFAFVEISKPPQASAKSAPATGGIGSSQNRVASGGAVTPPKTAPTASLPPTPSSVPQATDAPTAWTQIPSLSDYAHHIEHRWVKYAEDKSQTSYIDLASIIREGATLTVLDLEELNLPIKRLTGEYIGSTLGLVKYDCGSTP